MQISRNVSIESCHIFKKHKKFRFIFDFLDQICPKWIKVDKNGFLTNQKMLLQCTLDLRKILGVTKIFLKSRFFLTSSTSNISTWSNWIFTNKKNVTIKICHENKKGTPNFWEISMPIILLYYSTDILNFLDLPPCQGN